MIDSERLPDEADRRANQAVVRQAEGGASVGVDAPLGVRAGEMRRHALGGLVERMSRTRRLLNRSVMLAFRLEGGQYWSATAREILRKRCGVTVGAYSYGECFVPYSFPPGTVVGRYVSIANGIRIFPRNHPMDRVSTHPFFFNALMGVVAKDNVESNRFVIESDAWIGENAIFTPGCKRVGIGAVVGAGSIVTKDVPDFAVVVGNPAKVIRLRFDDETCAAVLASRWWERSLEECRPYLEAMTKPMGDWRVHPVVGGK